MIARLYAVELRRLWYRRAGKILALALIAITVITFAVTFRNARSGGNVVRPVPAEAPPVEGELQPPPDVIYEEGLFYDPRFVVHRELPNLVLGIGGLVAVGAFVFGATAGGADWSAGTVQALLFWEPRRIRVILAKAAALASVVIVFAFLMQLLSYGLGSLVASARGTFEGTDSQFWRELLGRSLRLSALAGFTSLLAFGIAGFTRNTGAALGVAFAYFVILENLLRVLRPRWQHYLLTENVDAFIRDGVHLSLPAPPPAFERAFFNSGARAGTVLAVYLAIVLGVLVTTFTRRDVT